MTLKGKGKLFRNILALFLGFMLITGVTTLVYSFDSSKVKVIYGEGEEQEVWETDKPFDKKWFTALKDGDISFIVDLKDYYENIAGESNPTITPEEKLKSEEDTKVVDIKVEDIKLEDINKQQEAVSKSSEKENTDTVNLDITNGQEKEIKQDGTSGLEEENNSQETDKSKENVITQEMDKSKESVGSQETIEPIKPDKPDKPGGEDDLEVRAVPIEVIVNYNNNKINLVKSVEEVQVNGQFSGEYKVNIALPESELDYDLDVEIRVIENSWGIPVTEDGVNGYNFIITRDTVAPVISVTAPEDGKYIEAVNVSVDNIEELHIETTNLIMEIYRDVKGQLHHLETVTKQGIFNYIHRLEADNNYVVKVYAVDKIGNKSEEKIVRFTINKAIPNYSINASSELKPHYTDSKMTIEIWDDSGINFEQSKYRIVGPKGVAIDEGNFNSISENKGFKELALNVDGNYELWLSVIDNGKGEYAEKIEFTHSFAIDTKDPVISIVDKKGEVTDGKFFGKASDKNITVIVNDSNLNNNNFITVTKDGQPFLEDWNLNNSLNNERVSYNFNEEGQYTISVTSIDKHDRKAEKEIAFTVDNTDPEIEISPNYLDGEYKYFGPNDDKNISIVIKDKYLSEGSSIKVTKNNLPYDKALNFTYDMESGEGRLEHEFTADGHYVIDVIAKDKADNNISKKFEFTVDNIAPAIKIEATTLENNKVIHGSHIDTKGVNLQISVEDVNHHINKLSIVGIYEDKNIVDEEIVKFTEEGNFKKFNYTFVNDAQYTVEVESVDKSGNSSYDKFIFVIDTQAPVISIKDFEKLNNNYHKAGKDVEVTIVEENYKHNLVSIVYDKVTPTGKGNLKDAKLEFSPEKLAKTSTVTFEGSKYFKDDGVYTIKMSSVDVAGHLVTQNLSFIVDTKAPVITVSGLEDESVNKNQHYNTDRNITIIAEDFNRDINNIVVYKDDNVMNIPGFILVGSAAKFNYNFTQEGKYKIVIDSKDKALWTSDKTIEFVIDKQKPIIKINDYTNLNNKYFNYDQVVTVEVDEYNYLLNTVQVTLVKTYPDGKVIEKDLAFENQGKITKHYYSEFYEDAQYKLIVTSKDAAGNIADTITLAFVVDKTKPQITIDSVEHEEHYNTDKYVTVRNHDVNHEVNTISVTKDGQPYGIDAFKANGRDITTSHNFTQEGIYEIRVESKDKAGNTNSKWIRFTIDKTAPVITALYKGENREIKQGEYINRIFTPEFKIDKPNVDKIDEIKLNGGPNLVGAVPMSSAEMIYNYYVLASDKAGNTTTLNLKFTVDTSNPKIKISGITSGFFNENMKPEYEINDTNLDNAKTSALLNGASFVSGTEIKRDNYYNLKLVGTDLADNVTSRNVAFAIDKENPVIIFVEPMSGEYYTETILPQLIIDNLTDYIIISMTLDGEDYIIGDEISEEGKHVLFVEVKDAAGNISSVSIEFIIDKTAPKFIVNGIKNKGRYYDGVSAEIKLDNPQDTIKSITVNGEPAQGEIKEEFGHQVVNLYFNEINDYEVILKAEDNAGNVIEEKIKFAVSDNNIFTVIYNNKIIFYPTLVIGAVAIIYAAMSALRGKINYKTKEDSED